MKPKAPNSREPASKISSHRKRIGPGASRNAAGSRFKIELEREEDGRWLAAVPDLAGVMAYGASSKEVAARAQRIALSILLDRLKHHEDVPELNRVFSIVA